MRPERWIYTVPLRLRSLFHRQQADQELDQELQYHIERKTEEYLTKGMTPREARRTALLEMGGFEKRKEECRDARRLNWIQDLMQDLRYGLRLLGKSPGFTFVAVLTLALGIGANAAIFSVVSGVLLQPLPYPHADELVHLGSSMAGGNDLSAPEFLFLRDHPSRAFRGIAAIQGPDSTMSLQNGSQVEYVKGMHVSESLFPVLGVTPFLGRNFLPSEDHPAGPHAAILDYGFWRSKFAADTSVMGRHIELNHEDYTVVGVLPQNHEGHTRLRRSAAPDRGRRGRYDGLAGATGAK
jgi:MacB-like periplasmic core domain